MDEPESNDPNQDQPSEGDPLAPEEGSLVGTVVADRYQVQRLLGEGAMGAVYRARHIHMQKDVALKVLHQAMSSNSEVVRRFEREAVAAGRVEHPNVAGATDFGRLADGSFYLVLEYIDGQSLGGLIEETGVMPPERACRIAAQIAGALAAAHAAGIVHRDLKPENVMLPKGEHEGDIVKVLDFGMAKMQETSDATETKLTMHGAVYGTPAYMAPEQAAGEDVDHRADLYALGLMLYEMLSGRGPFEADQVMALLIKHMTEKPPPLPASVPRPLSKLVMKLLEKKPENRYQSADEVLAELSSFLGISLQNPLHSAVGLPSPSASRTPRPPSVSVAAMKEQVADQMAKMAPMIDKAVVASAPAVSYLKEPMTVQGKTFPRWVPAAGAAGFIVVLLGLLLSGGTDVQPETTSKKATIGGTPADSKDAGPAADPDPPDAQLAKVILAASEGSEAGLYALEQRDDADRSLTEWMGLAQARLLRKQVETGLSAFKHAIEMDKSRANDKRILGALRVLADKDEYADDVLSFAADELGSVGADFLFHVWSKTSLKTKSTTLAFDKLDSRAVKANYSPELAIALKLRDTNSCEEALKLLPEVERVGDTRSMGRLRDMKEPRGCGDDKRDDCYPCMREGKNKDALQNALQAAAMRAAPQFELSRWRWR